MLQMSAEDCFFGFKDVGFLLVVALRFVTVRAFSVPMARLVADSTLRHLLQLLNRHFELALLKRRYS
jgi:hypothetical protein